MQASFSSCDVPIRIVLHQKSRLFELEFEGGRVFQLPFELMRVYSPSAEVRGHGVGNEVLQVGKCTVEILSLEPVGLYAIKPTFSDGHDSGLFSWSYLLWLGENQDTLWTEYLARLKQAGASREPLSNENQQHKGACAHHGTH